jgi:maleylacetate reductase
MPALPADELPLAPGIFRFSQMERIIWGTPVERALSDELELLGCKRVFVVTNRSLAGSSTLAAIERVLGERYAGRYDRVTAHTPRECVIAGAAAAREAGADKLLALGGGSVIDGTKAVLLCLRHAYTSPEQMEPHANVRPADLGHAPPDAGKWLRMIAIPTTLSGAEFAAPAGVSDPSRGMKHGFVHPMQIPQSVILDPAMTLATPLELLRSTGMKAVDHAVERITSRTANPYSDAVSELALRMLATALPALAERPEDLHLRSKLQYGMFMSLRGSASGGTANVSHAIGHVIGAHSGVPHGHTTGVTLPSVLRWMAQETAEPQRRVAAALSAGAGAGDNVAVADPAPAPDADAQSTEAADAVEALAVQLGLPVRMRDVGVRREDLDAIAEKTMHEALLKNSRRPVQGPGDIREILESAW